MIRRVFERRVRLALDKPPTVLQVEAANSYAYVAAIANRLYITEQTANILGTTNADLCRATAE